MASEIRVNTITDRSGINTITFASSGFAFSGITTVGILSATENAQFSANLNVTGTVNGNVNSTGVSTFTSGPVLIGSGTSTGTASQRLQVTGGAYVSGNLGIATTNPTTTLQVQGTTKVETSIGSTQSIWYTALDSKNYSAQNVSLLVQPETAYSFDASQTAGTSYEPLVFSSALTSANSSHTATLYTLGNYSNIAGTTPNARVSGNGLYNSLWRNSITDVSSYTSNILYGISNLVIQGTNLDQSVVTGIAVASSNNIGIRKATATNIYNNYSNLTVGSLVNNSASSTNAYGFYNNMQVGAASGTGIGTITNYYGYYGAPTVALTGQLTNYYGIYLATPIVNGTLTNRYSIYSSDTSSPMYHAGSVGIGTTNPDTSVHIVRASAQNDTHGILKVESTNATTGGATNSSLIVKNRYGWSQFMQWENYGLRIGTRSITGGSTGDVSFTSGADVEAMRLTAAGNLTLNSGNLVIGTAGKGIDFSATANSSGTMTSELLADYEEGTWTPTLLNGGSVPNIYDATYTKIGRIVTLYMYITTTSIPSNSSQFQIGGLPYTVRSGGHYSAGQIGYCGTFNLGVWRPIVINGGSYMYFHRIDGSNITLLNSGASGLTELLISIWYYSAA
jgi:hypothetical protein